MPPGSPVACTHSSVVTRQWFKNVPILCTQKVGQSVIYLWKGSQVPSVIGILCFVVRIFIAGLDKWYNDDHGKGDILFITHPTYFTVFDSGSKPPANSL